MCWDARRHFAAETRSPAAARRFCTQRLSEMLTDRPERAALLDDLALVVTELVTNSLNAGASATTVRLSWHRHQLRLAVEDDAPGIPMLRSAASDDSHGRGLAITESLSLAWGVQSTPAVQVGKRVWADFAVAPTLTTALPCTR